MRISERMKREKDCIPCNITKSRGGKREACAKQDRSLLMQDPKKQPRAQNILNIWSEHFSILLNGIENETSEVGEPELSILDDDVDFPSAVFDSGGSLRFFRLVCSDMVVKN